MQATERTAENVSPVPWRERELLTISEVAGILGLSLSGCYGIAERGELPGAVKIGNIWRVKASRLAAHLDGAK